MVGQELEPRAYLTLPVGVNFFAVAYGRSSGNVIFDPALPVEDVRARVNSAVLGYARSIDFFGRSASLGFVTPYVWGELRGRLEGHAASLRRSGLADSRFRFALNLLGGPALRRPEFAEYRQKTNLGFSLVAVAPLGQHDPVKLINLGSNRWAFKPEIGLSRALGRWIADVYVGTWFFTRNKEFRSNSTRKQKPIGVVQSHLSYSFRPRLWTALDVTFYTGGRTTVDDLEGQDLQRSSRVGLTQSLPLWRGHSLKLGVSIGAFSRIGADFNTLSVAYQYVWF